MCPSPKVVLRFEAAAVHGHSLHIEVSCLGKIAPGSHCITLQHAKSKPIVSVQPCISLLCFLCRYNIDRGSLLT
jgi:hypothetical protein